MTKYAVPPPDYPLSTIITPFSRESIGVPTRSFIGGQASTAWPSANLGLFVPFVIPPRRSFGSLRAVIANGAAVSGNVDVGVYRSDYSLIASTGAVAQSGTSTIQDLAALAVDLGPGQYYLGMSCSSGTATNTMMTTYAGGTLAALGCFQMAAAHPLPATVTPAVYAQSVLPLFGISRRLVF